MQRVDQRDEFGAFGLGRQHAQQPLARSAITLILPGGQRVHQAFELDVGVAQLLGVDEVLGQLTGEPQHHRSHGGRGLLGVEVVGVLAYDAESQLPQFGFAQQASVRFDGQKQTVFAQQVPGERVVGADGGRIVGEVGHPGPCGHQARPREPGEPRADTAQQLAGGLAGERQPEHLARPGVSVGDQPHHPRCHRLGLARAGTGDDDQRAGRCGDHRGLLVGGREKTERRGEFVGTVARVHR